MPDPPLRLTHPPHPDDDPPEVLPPRVGVAVVDRAMGKSARGPVPARELAMSVGLAAASCWLADRVVPFPWNAVVLGFGLMVAGWLLVRGRKRALREREEFLTETTLPDGRFTRCAACGYTLAPPGVAPPRLCPECGTPSVRLAR